MSQDFWIGFGTAAISWFVLSIVAGVAIGRAIGHNGDGQ